MSTCQGAPPPHLNCPHGENCDWGQRMTAPEFQEALKSRGVNRADRRRAMKRNRIR